MVGHRFVEAMRARDTAASWRITVLAEETDAAYDRALVIDANDFETLMNKGNLYYNKGDYGSALAFYLRGVKADPGSAWAQSYLGDTYLATGGFSQSCATSSATNTPAIRKK